MPSSRQARRIYALLWPLLAACACAAEPAPSETSETSERECFACDAQRTCMAQSCEAQVSLCWGEGYFEGENGGACESVLDCQATCACADQACIMSCFADADPQCLSCSTQVSQCEQDECAAAATCGS